MPISKDSFAKQPFDDEFDNKALFAKPVTGNRTYS
jgi:hypothetical protein